MELLKIILKRLGIYSILTQGYDWINHQIAILIGIVRLVWSPNKNELFLFYPYYHTGGAEKVHLDILKALPSKQAWIIFTNDSMDTCFKEEFQSRATCFEVWSYLKKEAPLGKLFLRILIYKINACHKPFVFGANCLFFYDLIPQFKPHVFCADLIHAFVHEGEVGVETSSLPYVERINRRITINLKTKEDFRKLYEKMGKNPDLVNRIVTITNSVEVPDQWKRKQSLDNPKILFVSRNSPEKRVWLIGLIAKALHERRPELKIQLVGPNLEEGVNVEDQPYCQFLGSFSLEKDMQSLYSESHILLLCSTREGMPMVIMEAMAHGMVVISTDVGGIHEHVKTNENGLLISNQEEEKLVKLFTDNIFRVLADTPTYDELSRNAHAYARKNFGREVFNLAWKTNFEDRQL